MTSIRKPWDLEVKYLKGVGEKLSQFFAKADVYSLWDLLLFLPRTYEDRRKMHSYVEMQELAQTEETVLGVGVIEKYHKRQAGPRGRRWTEALVKVKNAEGVLDPTILFTWFYDPGTSLQKRFPEGTSVVFRGKAQLFRSTIQIVHPEMQKSEAELPEWEFGGFVPVYREISGLSTRVTRKIMALALRREEYAELEESLPENLQKEMALPPLQESLRELHFPKNWIPAHDQAAPAGIYLQRVAFEELFMMALAMYMRKSEWMNSSQNKTRTIPRLKQGTQLGLVAYTKNLPFELTQGQRAAMQDVMSDLTLAKERVSMHRLIQGDVGSGKTIVAFITALLMMDEGFQVALMAPTEILANQHYQNFAKFFPERSHECVLLKGALTAKQKKEARLALSEGRARFVVGTQALLSDDTLFSRLGLIIVDEQHRFGVKQRILMKEQSEGILPHLLVMTATPIPRSLALTIYGDLNLSVIRDKPVGRIPIETHLVKRRAHEALSKRLKTFVDEGRQIYLVYPLVEESEEMDLKDVQNAFKEWSQVFGPEKVALLHGKMKSSLKDSVMQDFKSGKTRVLVSTTVIEVGVDVPNASVIVIEHAERFGLSQLHQLRGRVGRGSEKSLCVLVGPDQPSPLVLERLQTLVESEDGFRIAEKDLEIRGPGEFLGRKQSGLPGFRVAHILRDVRLLERAREEAEKILKEDPRLEKAHNQKLKTMIERWWGGRMELTLSG
jgi:ATP-dependent DNA helicase RecG